MRNEIAYLQTIEALHSRWEPHETQIDVGRALFADDVKDIFVQCGRKWGKSEIAIYMLWRWANTYPGSRCYYICPFAKHAREIVWASRRIQDFGPQNLVYSHNSTSMRTTFNNGSFIKCDGADNYAAYTGINPHFLVYDEFKDFRVEFHETMDPNRSVYDSPLVIIGTPPKVSGQYTEMAQECRDDEDKRHFHFPTEKNPHISKDWLEAKKKQLYARGEGDVWEREYMAKFNRGGKGAIFPMLKDAIVKPHNEIIESIARDKKKLIWGDAVDPGTTTCFAALFGCHHPYLKTVYLLDEIYETDQKKTTVKQIGSRLYDIRDELFNRDVWAQTYDEAAAWFPGEMQDHFPDRDCGFLPTQKALNKKEDGLSLIKDIMLADKLVISDRCEKLFWEMENYVLDKKGKIPKENDHLIDCLRYLLAIWNYQLTDEEDPEEIIKKDENIRYRRISQDYPGLDDWGERTHEAEGEWISED